MRRRANHAHILPFDMLICYRTLLIAALLLVLVMAETPWLSAEETAGGDASGVVDRVLLDERELDESSGLAISLRRAGHFWTHNDSGGEARLYAFDRSGRKTGQIDLPIARPTDWEDLSCFDDQGISRLLVADCGDNRAVRESITLYLMDEPDPAETRSLQEVQTISVSYPDGPRDCEAVAVDPQRRLILLVSKTAFRPAGIYVVPLPDRETGSTQTKVTATRICTIALPLVTAMDLHQPSGDIWCVSYFHAFQFVCSDRDGSLAQQLTQVPKSLALPRWKQIEAVAVDNDHDLWVTSEGTPAPLGRLPQSHRVSQRPSRP